MGDIHQPMVQSSIHQGKNRPETTMRILDVVVVKFQDIVLHGTALLEGYIPDDVQGGIGLALWDHDSHGSPIWDNFRIVGQNPIIPIYNGNTSGTHDF